MVVLESRMTRRDVLDLGEDGFTTVMLLGLPIFFLGSATMLLCLGTGAVRLVRRKPQKREPWLRIGVIALVFAGLAVKRSASDLPNPITPESESVYLAIAAIARAGGDGYLSLDPNLHPSQQTARWRARARVDAAVPAYWPRAMLYVLVEENCVVLARGSGMLGTVGVRIYDRDPAVLHLDTELRRNSYLPSQRRITARMCFFTTD